MAESSTITREMIDAPQDHGEKTLWYMEVAGPDDMHAVPDFWTGLAWAAELNAFIAARAAKEKWAADDNWPLTQATIRRWTWSAEQHATMLARELSERQEHAEKRAAAIADVERENRELRAYLKAFCAATIDPEDRGRDVSAHEANPFITYQFLYVEEGDPQADRTITGGQVRRAMELVGFDKLKIQPSDRTIADELTEARDLRREIGYLRRLEEGALGEIARERRRQVEAEGWTPEHDDTHGNGEMATAAGCYAFMGGLYDHARRRIEREGAPYRWPWDPSWWKPIDNRRDLVKAGALILAELERLDRAALATGGAQ